MCGIAGIVDFDTTPDASELDRMLKAIVHRGPDDEGTYIDGPFAIGMRRLSIIDLAGGHQPISNEDDRVWVVLNGEIYNYIELRADLEAKGHRFKTHTDTEVLVHLYEEEGPDFISKLNGMFAFALWDLRDQSVLVARDQMGIKPLYWHHRGNRLVFASELKCLYRLGLEEWAPDLDALSAYLHLGYIPREKSPIRGVFKLLPGERMLFRAGSAPQRHRYWKLSAFMDHPGDAVGESFIDETRDLLDDAVRLQLRSDVPLGSFLSGGLDSSAITMSAARELENLDTFGIGFKGHHFDETPYARKVAALAGTRHHEEILEPNHLPELIQTLAWHLDEPNGDPAMLPSYWICQYSREKVKVALSGAGGDELFGGYPRHVDPVPCTSPAGRIRQLPQGLRRMLLAPLQGLSPGLSRLKVSNNVIGMSYWTDLADAAILQSIAPWSSAFSTVDWLDSIFNEVPHADAVNQRCYYDATTYMPDQILAMTDRASMAVSLEVRVPLLDTRLVERMALVSGAAKICRGGKTVLKDMMRPRLPPEILDRRKLGFALPVVRWVSSGPIRELLATIPSGRLCGAGLVDAEAFAALINDPPRLERHAFLAWNILMLELWMSLYT